MESSIPVPTDNIYKFLATFGLVVIVASLTLMVINTNSTNQAVWKAANEYYDLSVSNDPRKDEKGKILETQMRVAASDRKFVPIMLSIVLGLGGAISFEGFRRWSKVIQPLSDEIRELQREKLKLEIEQLRRSAAPGPEE